jgi:5'-deoxynucleotidase
MPFQRELRDLAYVPRWSIVRVAKPQSVAEHSYYTAVYALQIARLVRWEANWLPLVEMALWHDVEECFTGDMPGPVKHELYGKEARSAIINKMTARFGIEWVADTPAYTPVGLHQAQQIVRVASLVDDAMFLAGELQRGNEACHAAMHSVLQRLRSAWIELPGEGTDIEQSKTWRTVADAILHERNGYSVEPDR